MSSIISLQPQIRNNHNNRLPHGLDEVTTNKSFELFNNSSTLTDIKNNVKKRIYQEYKKKDPKTREQSDAYDLVIDEIKRNLKLRKQNNVVSTQLKKSLYQTFPNAKLNTKNNTHKVVIPLEKGKCGKHKDSYKNKALGLGYVVGKSKTASKDAEREQAIEKYTDSLNNPELRLRISTQKPITQKDIDKDPALKLMLSKSGIDPKTVAKFELKNKHGIEYETFHGYIKMVRENKNLSMEQKAKIAKALMNNFISTLYYLGVNKISNADLHGENLKISFKSNDIFNPSQIEHLEVFDWGKSTEGDNFKFNETLDFTLKEGDFLKKAQQKLLSSNELRSRRMVFADIMSLVAGSAALGYKEFKRGDFAKKASEVYSKLNQINKKYSNREHSPVLMQKYQNAYLKTLTIFASFAEDRIDKVVIIPLKKGKCGKHKDSYKNKALGLGYVVGKSKTASKDAEREQAIEKYTDSLNNPELRLRISTQKPITQKDIDKDPALKLMLSKSGIDPKTVAKFELKNKHGIEYETFHGYIKMVRENKNLSVEQKSKIAKALMNNFISTLYYLGVNKISNADLHGENLKISFKSNDIFNPSQIEHLEVFDWGKSTEGDNFKFNETLDFTLKEGDFLKKGQQLFSSDELRSRRMVFADIMSLVTGSAASGYKEFKSDNFANQANEVYSKLNQINKKYSNREHSPVLMQKYQNAYLNALTIFASFAEDRIDQLTLIAKNQKTNGIFSKIFMEIAQIKNRIIWQSIL